MALERKDTVFRTPVRQGSPTVEDWLTPRLDRKVLEATLRGGALTTSFPLFEARITLCSATGIRGEVCIWIGLFV
jgi:hypothetical protein